MYCLNELQLFSFNHMRSRESCRDTFRSFVSRGVVGGYLTEETAAVFLELAIKAINHAADVMLHTFSLLDDRYRERFVTVDQVVRHIAEDELSAHERTVLILSFWHFESLQHLNLGYTVPPVFPLSELSAMDINRGLVEDVCVDVARFVLGMEPKKKEERKES